MIETLIELCENETPINLGSLCNTFDEQKQGVYGDYSPFKPGIFGGLFITCIETEPYYIYYVPCDEDLRTTRLSNCNLKDDVYIVQVYRFNYEVRCNNEKYCLKEGIDKRIRV